MSVKNTKQNPKAWHRRIFVCVTPNHSFVGAAGCPFQCIHNTRIVAILRLLSSFGFLTARQAVSVTRRKHDNIDHTHKYMKCDHSLALIPSDEMRSWNVFAFCKTCFFVALQFKYIYMIALRAGCPSKLHKHTESILGGLAPCYRIIQAEGAAARRLHSWFFSSCVCVLSDDDDDDELFICRHKRKVIARRDERVVVRACVHCKEREKNQVTQFRAIENIKN